MGHHDSQELGIGGLVISEEVLAAIATTTAREIEGVSALVARPVNVTRWLHVGGSRRYVKISGNDAGLLLELSLRVRAGAKISALAADVQRAVKNAVQNMTGKAVARVNLRIIGADF